MKKQLNSVVVTLYDADGEPQGMVVPFDDDTSPEAVAQEVAQVVRILQNMQDAK